MPRTRSVSDLPIPFLPGSVPFPLVVLAVALETTSTMAETSVFPLEQAILLRRKDVGGIEIDQMGMVRGVALTGSDPVGIVTGTAGSIFLHDVLLVLLEGIV